MRDKRAFGWVMFALGILTLGGLGLVVAVALGSAEASGNTGSDQLVQLLHQSVAWSGGAFQSETFWSALGTIATMTGLLLAYAKVRSQGENNIVRQLIPSEPIEPEELVGVKPGDSGVNPAPGEAETPASLVRRGLSESEPGKALELFRYATTLKPAYAPAWFNLAAALYNRKRYAEALPVADQLNTIAQNNSPYMNLRAKILRALGRRKEALALAIRASQQPGAAGNVWHTLGVLHGDFRQYEVAATALKKSLEGAPGRAETWRDYGDVLDHLKQYEQALAAYVQCLKLRPRDFRVMVKRARVLLGMRRYPEALSAVEAALQVQPTFGAAERVHADVLKRMGKRSEAKAARSLARKLDRAQGTVAAIEV
jgi:predicted Zn-dependent protease